MQLSDWLAREGVKRKDFAEKIGVSPSYVTALCDGSLWPGRRIMGLIKRATGGDVTADDFMAQPAKPPGRRDAVA